MEALNGDTMKTLRSIKKRSNAVQNTLKVVSAMKIISAMKLKKMQKRLAGENYYDKEMKNLALQISVKSGDITHPAFRLRRNPKKIIILAVAQQRGFCGALSEKMFQEVAGFIDLMKDRKIEVETWVIGRRGARTFRKNGLEIREVDLKTENKVDDGKIKSLCQKLLKIFLNFECDQIVLAYNSFISILSHKVVLDLFLPVWVKMEERPETDNYIDFLYEPKKSEVLDWILNQTIMSGLKKALREAEASELAARMVSMDKAYNNARDMLKTLVREFNSLRQTTITKELMDIVGGAEVLRKLEN